MICVSDDEIKDYLKATNNKKSYLIEDYKKTKMDATKFIYIADHLEELRKKVEE